MGFGSGRKERKRLAKEEEARIESEEERKEEKEEKAYEARVKKLEEQTSKYLLTSSVEAYVGSVGKNLSDYDQKGVDEATYLGQDGLENAVLHCKKKMVKKGEDLGAEVIVKIMPSFPNSRWYYGVYMIGTALVPRRPKE